MKIFLLFSFLCLSLLTETQDGQSMEPDNTSVCSITSLHEPLKTIIEYVEHSDTDDRGDVISRENLAKVSHQFRSLIKEEKRERTFYHLDELEKIDRVEREVVEFWQAFPYLENLKNPKLQQEIAFLLYPGSELSSFLLNGYPETLVFNRNIKNLFKKRPILFPALINIYIPGYQTPKGEINRTELRQHLSLRQFRGLNINQADVQQFIEELKQLHQQIPSFQQFRNIANTVHYTVKLYSVKQRGQDIDNIISHLEHSSMELIERPFAGKKPMSKEQFIMEYCIERPFGMTALYLLKKFFQMYKQLWSSFEPKIADLVTLEDLKEFETDFYQTIKKEKPWIPFGMVGFTVYNNNFLTSLGFLNQGPFIPLLLNFKLPVTGPPSYQSAIAQLTNQIKRIIFQGDKDGEA